MDTSISSIALFADVANRITLVAHDPHKAKPLSLFAYPTRIDPNTPKELVPAITFDYFPENPNCPNELIFGRFREIIVPNGFVFRLNQYDDIFFVPIKNHINVVHYVDRDEITLIIAYRSSRYSRRTIEKLIYEYEFEIQWPKINIEDIPKLKEDSCHSDPRLKPNEKYTLTLDENYRPKYKMKPGSILPTNIKITSVSDSKVTFGRTVNSPQHTLSIEEFKKAYNWVATNTLDY